MDAINYFDMSDSFEWMIALSSILVGMSYQIKASACKDKPLVLLLSIFYHLGAWHLRNNTFYEAGKIQSWGVVVFTMLRECPMSKLNVFIESFVKISNGMGIKTCNKPSFCEYFRNGSLVEEIFKRAQSCKLKLLLAVLPGTTPYYGTFYILHF